MQFFRQTYIKRLFNQIFGISSLEVQDVPIIGAIQPTVEVEPEIDVYRQINVDGTGQTLYTTPADKDFYLTSISVQANGMTGLPAQQGVNRVTFYPDVDNGLQRSFEVSIEGTTNVANTMVFPKRGLKLKRGTAVEVITTSSGADGRCAIAGYIAGDR